MQRILQLVLRSSYTFHGQRYDLKGRRTKIGDVDVILVTWLINNIVKLEQPVRKSHHSWRLIQVPWPTSLVCSIKNPRDNNVSPISWCNVFLLEDEISKRFLIEHFSFARRNGLLYGDVLRKAREIVSNAGAAAQPIQHVAGAVAPIAVRGRRQPRHRKKYIPWNEANMQLECPLCLTQKLKKDCILTSCEHCFCENCYKQFWSFQDRHAALCCPCCRANIQHTSKMLELPQPLPVPVEPQVADPQPVYVVVDDDVMIVI